MPGDSGSVGYGGVQITGKMFQITEKYFLNKTIPLKQYIYTLLVFVNVNGRCY